MMSEEQVKSTATTEDVVADALMAQAPFNNRLDEKELLLKYSLDDLEKTFSMRDPVTGQILRETEACYECLADGFYGAGLHGTFYPEGATIVLDSIPNQHLRPLNRAAGVAYARWLESLPQNRIFIDIGDMSEAAVILAKDPRVEKMSTLQAQQCVIRLAEGLKAKREGKDLKDLRVGDINRNFAPQSGGRSAPMLGAKMSDLSQLSPGMTRGVAQATGPGAGVRKAAAAQPLGGPPPGR
jgi:hypothetical protein